MSLISRIFRPSAAKAAEGQYRDGPWYLPVTGGWLPHSVGQYWNYWQMGFDPLPAQGTAMVEACVSAYAQTVAMCPGDHWRTTDNGGRERVTTSALTRILRKPNAYQSISDFLLNATRNLYFDGNAYAVALRNDRFEISELHLMHARSCSAMVADTGEVFYALAGNEIVSKRFGEKIVVPARDVLHIKLHTTQSPLRGETPLTAAATDVATSGVMAAQQLAFYSNNARPIYVLSTDERLTADQITMLRERWNEQSVGMNSGKTPILSAGLKPLPIGISQQDAQAVEMLKLTDEHIALVYRIPLQVLGIGGAPFSSTELLMQSWIASGLGFALNHIEEAIGLLFGLRGQPDEYVEFNTAALLRSAHKDRIEALARGVQTGIYSPNEARAEESLPAKQFGDEPRVQQQVVPLSAASGIPAAPAPAAAPPAAAAEADDDEAANDNERARRAFRAALAKHVDA